MSFTLLALVESPAAAGFLSSRTSEFSFPLAGYWAGAVVVFGFVVFLAARRTPWRAAAGWAALALAGQACALQLVEVGPRIRLQLFYGWSDLLKSYRVVFLIGLLMQVLVVLWGAYRVWPRARGYLRGVVTRWAWVVFLMVYAYASFTIAPGLAQSIFEGGLAYQLGLHLSKLALGMTILCAGAVNLALASASIPGDALQTIRGWWDDVDRRRLPLLAALWVAGASSALAWFVLDRMPHVPDEVAYLFQAKHISIGRFWHPVPPDTEALYCPFQLVLRDKWFNAMPAGWPFVLAIGTKLGLPWLVNPLLGGIAILLAHAWVRRLYDRDVADGVTILLALSPWLLYVSASFMPHAASLVMALLCLLGVERAREDGHAGWAFLAGASAGALLHVRPLEAVIVAAVAGLWWLGGGWRGLRFRALAAATVGGTALTALLLAHNLALTGKPTRLPLEVFTDITYYPGSNRLGFGADVGNWGWTGLDALPGHGLIDVFMNTNQNHYLVNFELFGWAGGSLLFVLLMARALRARVDWLMWGIVLALAATLSLYWFSGGPDFGARYWYQMIVPFTVLTVRGAQELSRRADNGSESTRRIPRVWAFVVLASLVGLLNLMPWRALDKYHNYRGMRPDIRELARQKRFDGSLVLIQGPRWPDYAGAFAFNPARFEPNVESTVYVRVLGPESVEKLRRFYPGRPVWIVAGPTITGNGYQVVAGPFAAGDSIPTREVVPR